jgi:hypothetical protein
MAKEEETGGSSLENSLGKEIGAALGDIIRGLLKKPAEEAGNLIADGIGILGDRVRRKRENNAQLGMEEVRKKLEADGVDMKDITPPEEEELHLLVNGMSLAGDETVRDMWAGLFAKAIEPDSGIIAERHFISVLESLSPMDAKIIDFLAFTIKTDRDLRRKAQDFRPKDIANITPEEVNKMDALRSTNANLQNEAIQSIIDKAAEYGINSLSVGGWSDNLVRQGVIERVPMGPSYRENVRVDSFDRRGLATIVNHLNRQVESIHTTAARNSSPPERVIGKAPFGHQVQLEIQFTRFGRRLAEACGLI